MKNITKNTKTFLFASLIAAMILPSGMMMNEAEASEPYTKTQVDRAFHKAGESVTFNHVNLMQVDKRGMLDNEMSFGDRLIVLQYATLHNALINAMISENQEALEIAKDELHNGKFAHVFNDPNPSTTRGFWDSSACGITNGDVSTYPQTPTLYIGTDGHDSQADIEAWLVNNGQHIVNWPSADWGDLVYAEINTTGQGGCTSGEFRDEWNIYDDSRDHIDAYRTSEGWHTLNHDNEPNPELLDYFPPTYWWGGFVSYWHDYN